MNQFIEFVDKFETAQVIMPSKKYIDAFFELKCYTADNIPD